MKSTVNKVLGGLMDHKDFGFCVAHLDNNKGYVDGSFAKIEGQKTDCGGYAVFTLHKKDYNSEFNQGYRLAICDWFNENYSDYHPSFEFEKTSEEDEIVEIKREESFIFLTLPEEVKIMENHQSVRSTMIDYIVKHPYFDDNEKLLVDIKYMYPGGGSLFSINSVEFDEVCFYAILDDGNQIPIEDIDTDMLRQIVNKLYSNE